MNNSSRKIHAIRSSGIFNAKLFKKATMTQAMESQNLHKKNYHLTDQKLKCDDFKNIVYDFGMPGKSSSRLARQLISSSLHQSKSL